MAVRPGLRVSVPFLLAAAVGAQPVTADPTSIANSSRHLPPGTKDCHGETPLLQVEWASLPLQESEVGASVWRLPVSAHQPELLTEARVELRIEKHPERAQNWRARLYFTFPDPKPFGIPFTFQRVELNWQSSEGDLAHRLDWSNDCTTVGRGLFPHQEWFATIELPEGESLGELSHPVLKVWGSRN